MSFVIQSRSSTKAARKSSDEVARRLCGEGLDIRAAWDAMIAMALSWRAFGRRRAVISRWFIAVARIRGVSELGKRRDAGLSVRSRSREQISRFVDEDRAHDAINACLTETNLSEPMALVMPCAGYFVSSRWIDRGASRSDWR